MQTLAQRWAELDAKKGSLLTRAEEYAAWTLPAIFPRAFTSDINVELQAAQDSIGAQGVNHLSNKVTDVLFPAPPRTFFRLFLSEEMKDTAEKALASQGAGAEQSKEELAKVMVSLEAEMQKSEKKAIDYMNMVSYRPQAVMASKLLIITGNSLMYHPEGKPVQCFNLRDYCVVRDLGGEVIEIMTKEQKAFSTFTAEVQAQLRTMVNQTAYTDETPVVIYTSILLKDDGKFHVTQAGDTVDLQLGSPFWPKETLPWIPLTWNLVRGSDYGHGLVAEYSGAFHAVNVLSNALKNIAAIMGDIKFLVNPASLIDINEINSSPSGSYHSGKKDDITVTTLDKLNDAQFMSSMIERYERQIAQAFLLNSQLTRQAERVTAEEIRAQANELETSNGGIYSRLAAQWQVPTANIVLDQVKFAGLQFGILPKIITGMESLSRLGELDAIRMFLSDIALLNGVPEDVRAELHLGRFLQTIGQARQVDYKQFLKTSTEKQEEQAAIQEQQQQALAQQSQLALAQEAGKTLMKDSPQ